MSTTDQWEEIVADELLEKLADVNHDRDEESRVLEDALLRARALGMRMRTKEIIQKLREKKGQVLYAEQAARFIENRWSFE